ncbi:hypothetical protein CfE428DRAFT_0746 [Chthoniobacter flavus Ellin428]|uniref:Uncharacterized protein n=1 Tax=Chthoniobacter flavus Ellin428 TaxID=497964 RepID=B4CVQ9_9BACT|nr:hypothetical protein [Chthoniobacter flavus]EDY21501.1 hypothetical protein CfE428DRAFT_0746 [Chthoniobacter flavus Ellin428]TCO95452.1 hypothetical protein EV701_101139 [Chthoniobacter flavus]
MKSVSAYILQMSAIGSLLIALSCAVCHAVDLDPELAKYTTEFDPELANHPALAPEECAKQSPGQMYQRLVEANERLGDPFRVNGISSLAGEDQFYLAYPHELRIKTDHDYPQIKAFRKPLLKSFQFCMQYVAELYHYTSVRHEHARVPGRVEWILFQGGRTDFQSVEESEWQPFTNYEPALIERIGVAMGRAMLNPEDPDYPFDTKTRPFLTKCLASLAEAECQMTGISLVEFSTFAKPGYTLNRNSITSPSFTTYSLPSMRSLPASRALA